MSISQLKIIPLIYLLKTLLIYLKKSKIKIYQDLL